jgi:DnaJ-domain-containing protein 1
MSLLQRLTNATRASLNEIKNRTFGRSQRPLSELTDDELEEELLRRRRERASGKRRTTDDASPLDKRIAQFYANLELSPGATVEDIKSAYRRLMAKYHPDKHTGDPAKHRAATDLSQELTRAYRALLELLEPRRD